MATRMLVTVGSLSVAAAGSWWPSSGAESSSEQVLFQKRGQLSQGKDPRSTATQIAMVKELAKDVVQHKRPLTDAEKEVLDTIDKTIISDNLNDISKAHTDDAGILQDNADDVAACETELAGKAKIAANKNATATQAWAEHASCRAEEDRLHGEMKAAKGRLDDFLKASADGMPSCAVPGAEEAVEDVEAFMDANAKWYADHTKTYGDKLADWNARIAAHKAKVAECDAQQAKAQKLTCEWKTYVVTSQGEYDDCRTRTLKAYADTLALNKGNAEDRKAEWTAMKHLQCYINTLRADITATGEMLQHCETETIDTGALNIVEPTVAPVATAALAAMGDLSLNYGCQA